MRSLSPSPLEGPCSDADPPPAGRWVWHGGKLPWFFSRHFAPGDRGRGGAEVGGGHSRCVSEDHRPDTEQVSVQTFSRWAPVTMGSGGLMGVASVTCWCRLDWESQAASAVSAALSATLPALQQRFLLAAACCGDATPPWLPATLHSAASSAASFLSPALVLLTHQRIGALSTFLQPGLNRAVGNLSRLPGAATGSIAAMLFYMSERRVCASLDCLQRPLRSPLLFCVRTVVLPGLGGSAVILAAMAGLTHSGRGGGTGMGTSWWHDLLWMCVGQLARGHGANSHLGLVVQCSIAGVMACAVRLSVQAYLRLRRLRSTLSVLPSRIQQSAASIELSWEALSMSSPHVHMLEVQYEAMSDSSAAACRRNIDDAHDKARGVEGAGRKGWLRGLAGKLSLLASSTWPWGRHNGRFACGDLLACDCVLGLVPSKRRWDVGIWGRSGRAGSAAMAGVGGGFAGVVCQQAKPASRAGRPRGEGGRGGGVTVAVSCLRPGLVYVVRVVGVSADGVRGPATQGVAVQTRAGVLHERALRVGLAAVCAASVLQPSLAQVVLLEVEHLGKLRTLVFQRHHLY